MAQDKTFLQDMGGDPGPHIQIAESLDKTNLLFVNITGRYFCGSGGCDATVYADDGTGYKEAMGAMIMGSVYVTRTGGQVFLYLADPNVISSPVENSLPVEWILKDGQFVENKPPPRRVGLVGPSLLCVRSVDPSPLVRRHGCAGERFWAVAI